MMDKQEYVLWSTTPDTSTAGIERFCVNNAGRYNKTPEEMQALPLARLVPLMWQECQYWRLTAYAALSVSCDMPILVIADKAGEAPFSKPELSCSVLSGESLSQIFDVRSGISTTFYSDGRDIRCRDISEHGGDYYLFRELTSMNGLGAFAERVSRGEIFTESDLAEFSKSLAPRIHDIFGWPAPDTRSFSEVLSDATARAATQAQLQTSKEELFR